MYRKPYKSCLNKKAWACFVAFLAFSASSVVLGNYVLSTDFNTYFEGES